MVLMRFLAVVCLFDALNLIYSSTLKGAGDTRFIMWTIAALSFGVMIIPVYVAVECLKRRAVFDLGTGHPVLQSFGIGFHAAVSPGQVEAHAGDRTPTLGGIPIGTSRCIGPVVVIHFIIRVDTPIRPYGCDMDADCRGMTTDSQATRVYRRAPSTGTVQP